MTNDFLRQGIGPGPATLRYELRLDQGYGIREGEQAIDSMMDSLERGNISFLIELNVVPEDHPDAPRVRRHLLEYARRHGIEVAPWSSRID